MFYKAITVVWIIQCSWCFESKLLSFCGMHMRYMCTFYSIDGLRIVGSKQIYNILRNNFRGVKDGWVLLKAYELPTL